MISRSYKYMMQKDEERLTGDGSRQGYVYSLAEGQRSPHLSTYTARPTVNKSIYCNIQVTLQLLIFVKCECVAKGVKLYWKKKYS